MSEPVYPRGFTIFCDDIRQEVNFKHSLIGIYPFAATITGAFPATIPRLCLEIHFIEPLELLENRKNAIPLFIWGPGESMEAPALKGEIAPPTEDVIARFKSAPMYASDEISLAIATIVITFSPLVVKEPGWLRVRALYDAEIIKLGSLRFDAAPEGHST